MRKILIPWQSIGQHPTLPDQRHCITIIQTDRRHDVVYTSTPWLSGHPGGCRALLSCKWYGISSTERRKLLEWTQSMQQSWGSLLSIKQHNHTTKQLSSTKHCAHHQERHVISHWSRTCGTLHHGMQSGINQNHPWRIRPQANSHTTTNGQRNGRRRHQR
jgi:hypothetical protein